MYWKRGLGIELIFIGFFICLTARAITGAVIGFARENYLGLLGVFVLVVGIILIFISREWEDEEESYTVKNIEDILEEAGRERDVVFVLDSSGAIDYKDKVQRIIEKYPNRTYVPKRVLDELKEDRVLMRKFRDEKGHLKVKQINPRENEVEYKSLRGEAKEELGETEKHKDYVNLKKYIIEGPPKELARNKASYYRNVVLKLGKRLIKKYHKEASPENLLWLLKKEYRASKGDMDALTTAIYQAKHKHKTKLLGEDSHLEEAIRAIKKKDPVINKYLDYVKYRTYNREAA